MSIHKIYLLQQQPYRYKNTNDYEANENIFRTEIGSKGIYVEIVQK